MRRMPRMTKRGPKITKQQLPQVAEDAAREKPRELPRVALRMRRDGVLETAIHGDFSRLEQATGNLNISAGLVRQIASLGSHGNRVDEDASNFALGFVDSMAPQDAAETLLVAQMAAVHQATMMLARRLNHVETIPQQDAAERALNKLARTYAAQMEALKRYRTKVQQTVRVEHVTVESGGQAVVGNVVHGGRADGKA
jgi:hypothetical protein